MFFNFSSESKRGTNCGMYYLVTPIIGITLQPLTGIIAEKFGFQPMFLVGIFSYIMPIILLKFLPDFEWHLDVKEELSKIKFNWSVFLQGATSRINYSLIPIFSLFFLKTPRQFGNFFGYLAIIAAVAAVLNGYISDKIKNDPTNGFRTQWNRLVRELKLRKNLSFGRKRYQSSFFMEGEK